MEQEDSSIFYSTKELAKACEEAGFPVTTYTDGFTSEINGADTVPGDSIDKIHPEIGDKDTEAADLEAKSPRTRNRRKRAGWQCEIARRKRMHWKEYIFSYKVLVTENGRKRVRIATKTHRIIGSKCASKSCTRTKLRACNEFPESVRHEIFQEFWALDWSAKKAFVISLVDKADPKFPRVGSSGKRGCSFFYHLKLYGVRRPVCKQMFLNTIGMKSKQLWWWLTCSKNKKVRYNQNRPKQKSPMTTKELNAREYLTSLPKLPSHYCRSRSENFFLEPVFSKKQELYNHYKDHCAEKSLQAASRNTFLRIATECNISIYKPKEDQCDICVSQLVGNGDSESYKQHRQRKEEARNQKNFDKSNAQKGDCHVVSMDVQGVLLAPMLNASSLYYKTKLVVHNYTVYNLKTRHMTCYLWNETEGELVASVFATRLRKYLEEHFSDSLPIIIYSDGCTYQNRNVVLSNSLFELSMRTKKVIIQKYLEKGHTQMEVDSVHATIQRYLKGKPIYLPSDYAKICAQARVLPERIERLLPRVPRNAFPKKVPRLYMSALPISNRKFQDLQDILPVIPSSCHAFYKSLPYKK